MHEEDSNLRAPLRYVESSGIAVEDGPRVPESLARLLERVARAFIARCESGEVRSTRTRGAFEALLSEIDGREASPRDDELPIFSAPANETAAFGVPTSRAVSVLEEAESLVSGDRESDYAHPVVNFARISARWTRWLRDVGKLAPGVEIDGRDVAYMNQQQKEARETSTIKRDNRVDTGGYLRALERGEESASRQFATDPVPDRELLYRDDLERAWGYVEGNPQAGGKR